MGDRERLIAEWIAAVGLLLPTDVIVGRGGGSIAVAFDIDSVTETIEGRGDSDGAAADDVVRQLRARLNRD